MELKLKISEHEPKKLAELLFSSGAISFQVTDNVNEFTVFMCSKHLCVDQPQGGLPHGRVYCSLLKYGSNWHFKTDSSTHWNYFAEKMNIPEDIAKWVGPFISEILVEYGKMK